MRLGSSGLSPFPFSLYCDHLVLSQRWLAEVLPLPEWNAEEVDTTDWRSFGPQIAATVEAQ